MFFHFCKHCDPEAASPIEKHKKCPTCHQLLYYHCTATNLQGLYTHYTRHAKGCRSCPLSDRERQKKKQVDLEEAAARLEQEQQTQEPFFSWSQQIGKIWRETGIGEATFDLVLRSSQFRLAELHGHKLHQNGHLLLTPANQVLLLLVFLRENPPEAKLGSLFPTESRNYVFKHVERIARVLADLLTPYVTPPRRVTHVIRSPPLERAAFFTDTTSTPIPRPGSGQNEERKLFYNGKSRDWGLKFQISVGMDGKIWEHSQVYPCSKSDRSIFEESSLPELIARTSLMGVGDSHYVKCLGMYGTKKGSKQSIEYKDYNQDIENTRAIIENANRRLKTWKVIAGKWTHDWHNLSFFQDCVTIVCALLNLEVENGFPLRKNLRTLRPTLARSRHERKRRKLEEGRSRQEREETEGEESSEEESSEKESEEEEYHEIDKIVSHRKGMAKGQPVIFYRVKFLDKSVRDCTEDFITEEAMVDYHQHHKVENI